MSDICLSQQLNVSRAAQFSTLATKSLCCHLHSCPALVAVAMASRRRHRIHTRHRSKSCRTDSNGACPSSSGAGPNACSKGGMASFSPIPSRQTSRTLPVTVPQDPPARITGWRGPGGGRGGEAGLMGSQLEEGLSDRLVTQLGLTRGARGGGGTSS